MLGAATTAALLSSRAGPIAMRMSDRAADLLPSEVRYNAIFCQAAEANWDGFRACYPSEDAALDAAANGLAVILPYGADSPVSGFLEMDMAVDRSENIAGSYKVLADKLETEQEVLDVITKNPGVLGCIPEQLEGASADDIRRAASFAGGINSFLSPARSFLQSTSWWDEGKAKMKEKREAAATAGDDDDEERWDPLGFVGPVGTEDEDEDEDSLYFPEIVFDGVSYLYDLKGRYNGIEHVLLTMEGEPFGVWNPDTREPEECEFLDPDEDEDEAE